MRPIHRLMAYYRIAVIMGASGSRGSEASAELLKNLVRGYSTLLNPDGPAGPKRKLKKGVLNLAQNSGLPILAFSFCPNRYWTWPSWDEKKIPLPFSKLEVRIASPIFVGRSMNPDELFAVETETTRELNFYSEKHKV